MPTESQIIISPCRHKAGLLVGFPRSKTPSPSKPISREHIKISSFQQSGSSQQLSPSKKGAVAETNYEDAIECPTEAVTKSLVANTNNVDFEFTLFPSDGPRFPCPEEIALIAGAFPGCVGMSFIDIFLIVQYTTTSEFPLKPWPSRVAGLMLRITTKPPRDDEFRPNGSQGRGAPIILLPPIIRWETPSTESIDALATSLSQSHSCKVERVVFHGARLEVWLAGQGLDCTQLPFRAGNLLITYHLNKDCSGFGHEAAPRTRIPTLTKPDDALYGRSLRPGMMLSNGRPPGQEVLTSSGVPVRVPNGQSYVTVSAHGFPNTLDSSISQDVWHPTRELGHKVGTMVRVMKGTDIGLMRLEPGIRYAVDLFDDGTPSGGTVLLGLKAVRQVKIGDSLFLDSPFSGRCDGMAGRHAWQALPWGHPNPYVGHWLETISVYFGDSIPEMLSGTCGSAIYDETHHVVGFFHLAGDDGGAEAIRRSRLSIYYRRGWCWTRLWKDGKATNRRLCIAMDESECNFLTYQALSECTQ